MTNLYLAFCYLIRTRTERFWAGVRKNADRELLIREAAQAARQHRIESERELRQQTAS